MLNHANKNAKTPCICSDFLRYFGCPDSGEFLIVVTLKRHSRRDKFFGSRHQNASKALINLLEKVEPMAGIEPATDGLRNRCSTTELHWLPKRAGQANR
jgi:hypothetical protein